MKKIIAIGALGAAMVVLVFASIAVAQSSPDQTSSDQYSSDQVQSPDSSGQVAPDQSTGTDSSGQATRAPSVTAVNITNHAFDPARLNVAARTIVTWTNGDTEAHTVTADNGLFDSGVLEPGQSYSTWLGGSGTVAYHCDIHPDMKGSVVVGGASSGGETTGGGTTTGDSGSNPPNQATSVYP